MTIKNEIKPSFFYLALILSSLAALISIIVIIGWYLKSTLLVHVFPNYSPMQYNTALCMLLISLSVFLVLFEKSLASMILASIAFVLSSMTVTEYIFDVNFGIDEFFIKPFTIAKSTYPGRMAPHTGICFMLMGVSLFVLNMKNWISRKWVSCCTATIVISYGLVSLIGYSTGLEFAHSYYNLTGMAVHTSAAFVFVSIATFCCCVTYDRNNHLSLWMLSPLKVGALFVTLLLYKAYDLKRLMVQLTGSRFHENIAVISIDIIFGLIFLYLFRNTIRISQRLEEAELFNYVQNQNKTQLIRYVSHEMRNPLTSIIGFIEILREKKFEDPEVINFLESIEHGCQHMKCVAEDLLNLSRLETGTIEVKKEPFETKAWLYRLEKSLKNRAHLKGIHFEIHLADGFPGAINGDFSKLTQIVLNLVGNAFKYVKQDGHVKLDISTDEGKNIILKVSDDGIGIPKDRQQGLFQIFHQTHPNDDITGFGVGLNICKQYATLMNGTITFESEEGKGTTFVCTIPIT